MPEEIDFENRIGLISNFKGLVTLSLDRVIRHTVVHHSSTSTYIPNFIGIGKTFCRRTDVRMYRQTDGRRRTSEPHIEIIRLTLRSRPKNAKLKKRIGCALLCCSKEKTTDSVQSVISCTCVQGAATENRSLLDIVNWATA